MKNGLLFVVAVVALLSLAACGGGDGDDGPRPDRLNGVYSYTAFYGDYGSLAGIAQWGTLDANGFGDLTSGAGWQNVDGGVSGPNEFFSGTVPYDIESDRRMTWGTGASDFGPECQAAGAISDDGRVVAMATTQDGSYPGLALLSRREGSFDNASLDGVYHVAFLYRNADKQDGALWGTATFNGDGTGTSSLSVNFIGQVAGPFDYTDGYSVSSDGRMTWDWNLGLGSFEGGIHANGDLILLAGDATDAGAPTLLVMIKASTSATDATLSGDYRLVTLHGLVSEAGHEWMAAVGEGTSNGRGSFTMDGGTVNTDGVVVDDPTPLTFDYTVSLDGSVTAGEEIAHARGAVASSGAFAILAGGTQQGDDPQIWFLLR